MIRNVARAVSFVLAVFVSVMSVQLVEELQSSYPLGTQHAVTVSVTRSPLTKDQLIAGLDDLADSTGMTMLKVTADPDDVEGATDLVWFGSSAPVAATSVTWFDPSRTGRLIPSRELGDRPVDGYYVFSDCARCVGAWGVWAEASGATLQWGQSRSTLGSAAGFFANTGGGLATLAVLVLLMSVALLWFVSRARARSLRLLGGVRPMRIHADDIGSITSLIAAWSMLGLAVSAAWILARRGPERLGMVAGWMVALLAVADLLVVGACVAVSWLTRPTVRALAQRTTPLRAFARISTVVRIVAVVLAVAVLPFTLASATSAAHAHAQAAKWADARSAVTVRMSLLIDDAEAMEPHLAGWEAFLADADAEGLTALSWTYDDMVPSEDRQMGGFDHVVVTDPAFLDLMGVDRSALVPVSSGSVPASLREELAAQFEILTRDRQPEPDGTHWSTTAPGMSVPVLGGTLVGGTPATAEHPLLIVVDHPLTAFTFTGFTLSMMVNGTLVFTDADRLRELIQAHGLDLFITSVDNVADQTLDAAQAFSRQARLGAVASVLVVLALAVSILQSAQTWAGTQARRIFTRHTAGASYLRIVAAPILRETLFIVVA